MYPVPQWRVKLYQFAIRSGLRENARTVLFQHAHPMEGLIIFLLLGILVMTIVLPILAMVKASNARNTTQSLQAQLHELQTRIRLLEKRLQSGTSEPAEPHKANAAPVTPLHTEAPLSTAVDPTELPTASHAAPPPLPAMSVRLAAPRPTPVQMPSAAQAFKAASSPAPTPPVVLAQAERPPFTLEQFMGVKLFAWVGGLALFLGIIFFVKLSIERRWISPELRTAIGFVTGLALVAGGAKINAKKAYAILGQTLCATGVVVLYGMTYAAYAYYKFAFFRDPLAAFGLMALITITAFLLAVRMQAQVVAILGMLGGFLTPILCATGEDNPLGLFGYLALLDIGVLAVAKHRRWLYLTALAALGTLFMQLGWSSAFFIREGYAYGGKTWIAVAVFLGFASLFTAAAWWTKKRGETDLFPAGAALAACASAMLAAFVFLSFGSIAERPLLLYTFVLAVNLLVMAIAWLEPRLGISWMLGALATFLHLTLWTVHQLTPETLTYGLAAYLIFGTAHTGYSALWKRFKKTGVTIDAAWVPIASLILLLIPVLHFASVTLLLWPTVLVADLAIIGLALTSRSLLPVFAALLLTLFTTMCWLFKLPVASSDSLTFFLLVVSGFGTVFIIASCMLAMRAPRNTGEALQDDLARWMPVISAVLPFALLILAMLRLHVANPTPVFAAAVLLNLFLLSIGRRAHIPALPIAGLICTLILEAVWHDENFSPAQPTLPLLWYLGFHALFTLHPHVFRKQLAETRAPWAAAALAGAGTFLLVYSLVTRTWPNDYMGLLPLAFALPQLLSLLAVLKLHAPGNPARLSQLAWFGGMSLFFITLIFPIQFEKEWLTVAWALEGAALCWLFIRIPHPGLRATGAALLLIAFIRLSLNPEVLGYHARGEMPIWNWQLYTYGLGAAAMFLAARWLAPPRHMLAEINLRGLFFSLGAVLLFLLLNIEIADAFTPPGSSATVLEFSGNFARDMTYSIAWGLFALALLMIGFAVHSRHTRYAGIGLLGVTFLKLFLHDLAMLDSVYRIGALIVVSLIALAASFLYQRFLDRDPASDKPEQR